MRLMIRAYKFRIWLFIARRVQYANFDTPGRFKLWLGDRAWNGMQANAPVRRRFGAQD